MAFFIHDSKHLDGKRSRYGLTESVLTCVINDIQTAIPIKKFHGELIIVCSHTASAAWYIITSNKAKVPPTLLGKWK
jgi:hypothetical protein